MRLKFLNFSTRNVIRWTQYCARCCTQYRKQCCWTFQLSHRRWIWCWVICHPCQRRLLKGRLWYLPATHFAAHDYERAMPHTMVSTSANLQQFLAALAALCPPCWYTILCPWLFWNLEPSNPNQTIQSIPNHEFSEFWQSFQTLD